MSSAIPALCLGGGVACLSMFLTACQEARPPAPASGSGDGAFARLAAEVLETTYRYHPTTATYLGIHKYDDRLEDYSHQGATSELEESRKLRADVDAIAPATL